MDNWNNTIAKNDKTYFLGDLSINNSYEWSKRLNGDITYINGNHDPSNFGEQWKIIDHKGIKFFLIHNPNDPRYVKEIEEFVSSNPKSWIIYGHTHNNNLIDNPFINFKKKRINVSVELIGYRPIELDKVVDIIKSNKARENILYYNRN